MPCSCGEDAGCKCIKKPTKKRDFSQTSTVCRICKLPTPANVSSNEETSTIAEGKSCTCFKPFMSSSNEVTGLSASISAIPKADSQTAAAEMPVSNIAESEKDSWEREHSNSSDLYPVSSAGSGENVDRWRDVVLKRTENIFTSSTSEEEDTLKLRKSSNDSNVASSKENESGVLDHGNARTAHTELITNEWPPDPANMSRGFSNESTTVRESAGQREMCVDEISNEQTKVGENAGQKEISVDIILDEQREVGESTGQRDESANNNRQENEPNSGALSTEIQADPNQRVHEVAQQQFADWQLRASTLAVQRLDPRFIRYFRPPILPQPRIGANLGFVTVEPFISLVLPRPSNRPRQSYFFPPQNILVNPQLRRNRPALEGSTTGGSPRLRSILKVKDWIETLDSSPDNQNVIQPISDQEDEQQASAPQDSIALRSVSDQKDEQQARAPQDSDAIPSVSDQEDEQQSRVTQDSDVMQSVSDQEDEQQARVTQDSNVIQSVSDRGDDMQARATQEPIPPQEEVFYRGIPVHRKLSFSSTTDESSNNAGPAEQRRHSRPRRKVAKKETDKFNTKKE